MRFSAVLRIAGAASALALPQVSQAQTTGLGLSYGRWWHGGTVEIYRGTVYRPLLGPVQWGLGFVHLRDTDPLDDRTQSGGEISLKLGPRRSGPFLVGSAGLGLRHDDGGIDGSWSGGAGYRLSALGPLSLNIQLRYLVEDRAVRGFWRLDPLDREGFSLSGGLSISFGSGSGRHPAPSSGATSAERPEEYDAPDSEDLARMGREGGASREAARIAADVVATALEVMGSPYRWGGTDQNGFDCSGLIQYAYREHGIVVPRVSRDQARAGRRVEAKLEALLPGDVLGFSIEGDRVTHVGLYVGKGRFIHSASGGVKITDLTGGTAEGDWWRRRLLAARRIIG